MNIEGSIALVTGANRGIGLALTQALMDRGAGRIYAASRRGQRPGSLADDPRVTPITLDITDPEQVAAAAEAARDVTLLINNAGVLSGGSLLGEGAVPLARRDLDTNYFGTLAMMRAFVPHLQRNGGAAVNVLSVVSLAGIAGMGGYAASKAAALALTQSLRGELAGRVAVHAVFPGPVDTDMVAGTEMAKASPAEVAQRTLDGVEAGREDIFPDPMAAQFEPLWAGGGKRVEAMFSRS